VVSTQNDGGPSAQVIVVGVSTEVTVGIALASFVIGVGLTAILWCIHMRTGKRVGSGDSTPESALDAPSGISVPSSPLISLEFELQIRTAGSATGRVEPVATADVPE